MSEIVQLYKDEQKTTKVYPKTVATEVYIDENTTVASQLDSIESNLEKKEIFVSVTSGENITEKLNNVLINAPMFSKIIIPFGSFYVSQIIIPPNKSGIEICGVGRSLTKIECSDPNVLVSLQSEYITFRDIAIKGKVGNLNITCFSDDRPEDRDDFDLRLYNCDFQIIQTLVKAKGHSVIIENCLFSNWLQDGAIIESIYSYPLENVDGHRSYVVNNNRFHYINSCIMKNKGSLATSIDGIQITNNYIEGSLKYYEGYAKNLTIKNNPHIQYAYSSKHNDNIIGLDGGENIDIDINFSILKDNLGIKNLLSINGEINNLNVKGQANGVNGKGVQLIGGGTNINIDININSDKTTFSNYVHFTSLGEPSTYNNVIIKGNVISNNSSFIGLLKHPNVTLNNYKWNILINGLFSLFTSGLTMSSCIEQPTKEGFYLGDGATKTFDIKYTPRTIEVIETTDGGYHNLTITGVTTGSGILSTTNGFTVSGNANKNGVRYVYKIT